MKMSRKSIMRKWLLICLIFGQVSLLKAQYYPVRDKIQCTSLNGTWKIKIFPGQQVPDSLKGWQQNSFNDKHWQQVQVPGNWETVINQLKAPEYGKDLGDFTGLYRRTFAYNPVWDNKHLILRFDGVNFSYTVFVNGKKVGCWGSSYNLAQFDITPFLNKTDDNVLSVQVSTRSLPSQPKNTWQFDTNDDWSLSGISRDVTLFALNNIYLGGIDFKADILNPNEARVDLKIDLGRFKGSDRSVLNDSSLNLVASLVDPLGNHILDFNRFLSAGEIFNQKSSGAPVGETKENTALPSISFSGLIKNPRLWTAETPQLYSLEVKLRDKNGRVLQQSNQCVGLRSVKVEGYKLMVNNQQVHLRGVCLSEIDPKNGRAIAFSARLKELKMMKSAGINFIRTAHYPFAPEFYDLCDQLGFYICDEVPFGYGDKNLSDTAYLPELITRARSTITRDRNHPSVIVWSIGNENPYTPVVEKVIQYVKALDSSRPRGLPQRGSDYLRYQGKQSPNVDIYMPHYLDVAALNESLIKTDKPLILTEYAHSLGLAMDEFEEQYANIYKQPKIIGGSVWCWKDQALLTDGKDKIKGSIKQLEKGADNSMPQLSTVEQGVWIDQTHYMDNFGNNGADGIVYGNLYPQEDYYLVRKVYSPVQILTDQLEAVFGQENEFGIEIANRFDFKTLHGYQLCWQLVRPDTVLNEGRLWLTEAAQQTGREKISVALPQIIAMQKALRPFDYSLHLKIIAPDGSQISEKNLLLVKPDYRQLLAGEMPVSPVRVTVSNKGILKVQNSHKVLLETPLMMRVGRKLTITSENQTLKDHFNWNPYILSPKVTQYKKQKTDSGVIYTLECVWTSESENPSNIDSSGRGIQGTVRVFVNSRNLVDIRYDVTPFSNATGNLLECGLTVQAGSNYHTFHWIGAGPFSSSIGKTAYNERGVYALDKNDIRFNGNRSKVDLAAISASDGVTLGLYPGNGQLGVENKNGNILISQNAIITGYGSKFKAPKGRLKISDIKSIKGGLTIALSIPEAPVDLINGIFHPQEPVNPENPFKESYGW